MTSRRPRTPGLIFSLLALVLLVILSLLTLTAKQPPPPTIAEFAPQAVDQITDAPADQFSTSGVGGAGDCVAGQVCGAGGGGVDVSAPAPTPLDVPRVRKCVGDPPRQIEDPQSPPCVPYWKGDNGGATSKGVTRDEIRVVRAQTNSGESEMLDALIVAFFNKRFELYGRKLVVKRFTPDGSGSVPAMLADAQKVDEQYQPFAAYGYKEDLTGREYVYFDELARRRVMSVATHYTGIPNSDQADYRRFAPYQWTYYPSVDEILAGVGEMYCKSLRGRSPAYAGPPQSLAENRKLGIVRAEFTDGTEPVDLSPIRAALSVCGVDPVVVGWDQAPQNAPGVVLKLRDASVTSVLCLIHTGPFSSALMPASTNQGYYPEWLVTNYGHNDDDYSGTFFTKDQQTHVIGLASRNKSQTNQDQPWYWAAREMDPGYDTARNAKVSNDNYTYWNLLLLASGVQMTGPKLTPATFQAALFKSKFPNPGGGGPPYFQGTVGFATGNGATSHAMLRDLVPVWWSPSAQSMYVQGQTGAYCYVDRGTRYAPGGWPARELGFTQGGCR